MHVRETEAAFRRKRQDCLIQPRVARSSLFDRPTPQRRHHASHARGRRAELEGETLDVRLVVVRLVLPPPILPAKPLWSVGRQAGATDTRGWAYTRSAALRQVC